MSLSSVQAQEPAEFPSTTATEMPPMTGMNHDRMQQAARPTMEQGDRMAPGTMQGGSPPPDARDPHAYSDGYDFGAIPRPRFADEQNFASLRLNRLEIVNTDDNTWTNYDLQAWFGRDYDRLVLKAEGDIDNGKLEDASTELLWGHAVATFWDTQLGLRYDSGEDPARTWLAFGIQGLAPYWFEVDATAYIGEQGRTALNLELEYELLFTQKLILQPRIEINWHGKRDAERGLGTGLTDLSAGLRLRYEFRREFAPYIGIERANRFGETADMARASGQDPDETRYLAGLRLWF
ncbi:MAG TPA: copper resistance protein B [Chromatiales bacterium]|nr:copper resistance protein B [Chromatiales bacterium]